VCVLRRGVSFLTRGVADICDGRCRTSENAPLSLCCYEHEESLNTMNSLAALQWFLLYVARVHVVEFVSHLGDDVGVEVGFAAVVVAVR
jgi:hypothetical protein